MWCVYGLVFVRIAAGDSLATTATPLSGGTLCCCQLIPQPVAHCPAVTHAGSARSNRTPCVLTDKLTN